MVSAVHHCIRVYSIILCHFGYMCGRGHSVCGFSRHISVQTLMCFEMTIVT